MKRRDPLAGPSGIETAEEAFALLREAGAAALALYYAGTFPFVAGFITFWAAMGQSARAEQQLPEAAMGVALLFAWMKAWQSRYCQVLLAQARGLPVPAWTAGAFARSLARQAALQATGWIILPVSALMLLPFGWAYAAYQHATVLEEGDSRTAWQLAREAAAQAEVWPRQNHLILWLLGHVLLIMLLAFVVGVTPVLTALMPGGLAELTAGLLQMAVALLILPILFCCPVGVMLSINIALFILIAAGLLHSLFGIQTVFSDAGGAVLNSTFLVIVGGLAYLCMDPVLKAAYVLRSFHHASIRTGEDLRLQWRRATMVNGTRLLLLAMLLLGSAGMAQEHPLQSPFEGESRETLPASVSDAVDPAALDQAIHQELQQDQYAWHMPRELIVKDGETSWLLGVAQRAGEQIRSAIKWVIDLLDRLLRGIFGEPRGGAGNVSGWPGTPEMLRFLLFVLVAVLLVSVAVLLWRARRVRREMGAATTPMPRSVPDLTDEATGADALPEEGWRDLANELMERGEYRLAARALFLAMLAWLAEDGLVRLARFKSNRDYAGELRQRSHVHPQLLDTFCASARMYEAVWYGPHLASEALVRGGLMRNFEVMREHARE